MRSAKYFVAAAFVLGLAGTASAQGTSTATTQPTTYGATVSHWVASGFAGGGFNASSATDDPRIQENGGGVSFGGQVGYLWHGFVGPEFLAEWAPSFDVNAVFVDGNTHVHSYMLNAIASAPLGADGQLMPFISGGYGRIAMSADIINPITLTTDNNTNSVWGSNIGGGIMAFASERFGVRGDLRYYHASNNTNLDINGSVPDQLVESIVSGVHFWRATGGLSVRW
ncbi:MAG TPA: hypothetical protein VL693_19635 [Vicinamibacterales bacterium]|jgi:outer membrane protein with beta-barrel domain|nr:hypothetical protein [Vicinamibacterales bacterium]